MSAFTRFLHHAPASRRAYSSFFSSKPGGGGRYFNSAKAPKAVIAGSASKSRRVDPPQESKSKADAMQGATGGASTSDAKNSNQAISANPDQATQSSPSSSPSSSAAVAAGGPSPDASKANTTSATSGGQSGQQRAQHQHPIPNAKDFKLHQFFSLHRPLLLLSTPSSILTAAPANVDLSDLNGVTDVNPHHSWLLGELPEASTDADAAAARQLTRALTINHAGAAVAWEATLRRLGLDVDKDQDRLMLQQKWDREWQEVMMDSTKRKRRKKMKKHKLKKRRKATRASRVKIGR